MEKTNNIIMWVVFGFMVATIFATLYLSIENSHQISVLKTDMDSVRQTEEKMNWVMEHPQAVKDTIVININTKK